MSGVLALVTACKQKEHVVYPQLKQLTEAVYASGTLVPEHEYQVLSSVDGYIFKAFVKEGDTVHVGQLLFKTGNEVRDVQEQGARAVVEKTIPTVLPNAPSLQQLQEQMEVARIKKNEDSFNYLRYKFLYEQDAISKTNYEKYYLQYQSSLKDYQDLGEQYRQQKLTNALQLQQAKNQLSVAAAQSDVGHLKSFVNGVVYDVYKKQGDLITPTQPLALVGSGKMFAHLLVDEDDLDKVQLGQKILITMDAFPDRIINAHVQKIYPLLNKVEQSFRVDAALDEPVGIKMYGLNLEANIVIAENKSVLAIPKSALLKGDSIIIRKDGKRIKMKVQKGVEDDQWVEVRGLDSSSAIIVKQ
jgi:multidrug efflux pump subunit AcrA (membrane-fusion protein)